MKDLVVLVNFLPAPDASFEGKGRVYPATAIMLIGTYLSQNGYRVLIVDGAYHEDYEIKLRDIIHKEGPNILYVGMSVMVTQIPFALSASKIVKEITKDIPIVWGGPHATLYPEETLRDDNVDIVVINEGTITAYNLACALREGLELKGVTGIAYRDAQGRITVTAPSELEDISKLPFFDFSLIDIEQYLCPQSASVYKREFPHYNGELRIVPILTGLGCPYKCQFCINVILKRRYRFRSARTIVEEIKRLKGKYGANTFLFLDEDFFISKKRLFEFLSICEDEDLHFNFRTWCRVDHFKDSYLNKDTLKRMSRIGHVSIAMGGESANREILLDLQKGITPEEIINSLKIITASGKNIFPRYSFMVGMENESLEQIKNTYRFCLSMKELNPSVDIAGPFIFRLYPGSPIFDRIVRNYKIKLPETPAAWANYISCMGSYDEMPWTPEFFQKNKHLIEFYANYAFYVLTGDASWDIKRLVKKVLIVLSRLRIKHFFFSFPYEYEIFKFIRKRIGPFLKLSS